MKIETNITGLPDIREALKEAAEEIPRAMAETLTFTAERVQHDLRAEMVRVFDRPTRFTLNGIYKTSATPKNLEALVKLKDEAPLGTPAAKYLNPQIEGGPRSQKRVERNLSVRQFMSSGEFMYPGKGAPLDTYGNLPRGQIVKALSNIGGQWDAQQNTASPAAKRRLKKSGRSYFWIKNVGIMMREGRSLRSFMTLGAAPKYKPVFDFFGVCDRSVSRHLPGQMERAIERALKRAAEKAQKDGK